MPGRSKVHGGRVGLDVIIVLAERGADGATRYGIADDIEHLTGFRRSAESVRRAINYLHSMLLVEKAGRSKRPPSQKSGYPPTIWKLHKRLRYAA